jgi:hypothetical protein
MSYPAEVNDMFLAITRLPGVVSVNANVQSLEGIDVDSLGLLPFHNYPHMVLRLLGGGKEEKGIVWFEFRLKPDNSGWKALEILAWWVKDLSRSGHNVQLRPVASAPVIADDIQLGRTLTFQIEMVFEAEGDDLSGVLAEIKDLAGWLDDQLSMHESVLLAP